MLTARSAIFAAALTAVAGIGLGAATPAHADEAVEACTATKFTFDQVGKACKDGGRKAAKAMMKEVVTKAKAAGEDVKCNTCHESLKTFDLKPNAVADLKKWL
jgi:hypothetical protein